MAELPGQSWTLGRFLYAVLDGIGAPRTLDNYRTMVGWALAEGVWDRAANNPLATTFGRGPAAIGASIYNSHKVRHYASPEQGVWATVQTLLNGKYDNLVQMLRRGTTPEEFNPALRASPWGTGHGGAGIPVVSAERAHYYGNNRIIKGSSFDPPQAFVQAAQDSGATLLPDGQSMLPNDGTVETGFTFTSTGGSLPTANDIYPQGGELLKTIGLPVLRYKLSDGVWIEWVVTDQAALERSGYDLSTAQDYYQPDGKLVDFRETHDASELGDLTRAGYSTVQEFFQDVLQRYFSPFDPAVNDPEIQWVIAKVMANPDVSDAVVDGWIQSTHYWERQTQRAAEFNSLSPAEQQARVEQQAMLLVRDVWNNQGVRVRIDDPKIKAWAWDVASGTRTYASVYQEIIDEAAKDPESPYSRSLREEEQARGQFNADVDTVKADLRKDVDAWGVAFDEATLDQWANDIVMNDRTRDDWLEYVKDTAARLYPWKDRELRTIDAAQPWLNAYSTLLEKPATLRTPEVQAALMAGTDIAEFTRQLRQRPEWLTTKNAQDTFSTIGDTLARRMGFA